MDHPADTLDAFEDLRPRLTGLAYRMLGSMAEAEDVVQEAWLRWYRADRAAVVDPPAYLSRVVTRLSLDALKSARARREVYVGPWLPEPVLDASAFAAEAESDYAHDLSVGLLLALERLSPLERAAFLLHDVFDVEFAEVAAALDRSEVACRQLAARARTHVRSTRPRFPVAPEAGHAIVRAFVAAADSGDASGLTRLLAEDAVLHSDGGGKVRAALRAIRGRDRVVRFTVGISRKLFEPRTAAHSFLPVNGLPGLVTTFQDGSLQATAFQIEDGRIVAIYIMRNPDKLARLAGAMASPGAAPE